MNRYLLAKAGISVRDGIERFGSAATHEEFLKRFPADESFSRLRSALSSQDAKSAFAAAHALKGLAGNLSMTRLHDDLVPLVEVLRGGTCEKTGELFKAVEDDYDAILAVLVP